VAKEKAAALPTYLLLHRTKQVGGPLPRSIEPGGCCCAA
jgi:hypothetical protein